MLKPNFFDLCRNRLFVTFLLRIIWNRETPNETLISVEKEPQNHKILFDITVPIGVYLFQKFQKAVKIILPSRGRFEFIGRNMSSRFYFICRNDERLTVTLRSLLSSLLDHLVIRRRRRFLNIWRVAQMVGRTLTRVVSKLNFWYNPYFFVE